jgi:hypothetical protein
MMNPRPDLMPVYTLIFRRMHHLGLDWPYVHPRVMMFDGGSGAVGYDPVESYWRERKINKRSRAGTVLLTSSCIRTPRMDSMPTTVLAIDESRRRMAGTSYRTGSGSTASTSPSIHAYLEGHVLVREAQPPVCLENLIIGIGAWSLRQQCLEPG